MFCQGDERDDGRGAHLGEGKRSNKIARIRHDELDMAAYIYA